jgi:hypothetical protein
MRNYVREEYMTDALAREWGEPGDMGLENNMLFVRGVRKRQQEGLVGFEFYQWKDSKGRFHPPCPVTPGSSDEGPTSLVPGPIPHADTQPPTTTSSSKSKESLGILVPTQESDRCGGVKSEASPGFEDNDDSDIHWVDEDIRSKNTGSAKSKPRLPRRGKHRRRFLVQTPPQDEQDGEGLEQGHTQEDVEMAVLRDELIEQAGVKQVTTTGRTRPEKERVENDGLERQEKARTEKLNLEKERLEKERLVVEQGPVKLERAETPHVIQFKGAPMGEVGVSEAGRAGLEPDGLGVRLEGIHITSRDNTPGPLKGNTSDHQDVAPASTASTEAQPNTAAKMKPKPRVKKPNTAVKTRVSQREGKGKPRELNKYGF